MSVRGGNILGTVHDPALFAPWFRDDASWQPWFAFLAALFSLDLTDAQREIFQQCTARQDPPSGPVRESWIVAGRRAGKSFILALCAVYLACFRSYQQYLVPGERATVMIIACDRRQARIIHRYVGALLSVPALRQMLERETASGFDLSTPTPISIEVHAASFRSTRGYAIIGALLDELAFWPTDSDAAEPDFEVIAAVRAGMAQFPTSVLLCASSPYARKGALWEAYHRHFGKDDDGVLIWQAATRRMNPSIPQSVIDRALESDAAKNRAEFLAEFRSDIEGFLARDAVLACVSDRVYERPYQAGTRYSAFVDPAGGTVGGDSFTLAVAHREGDQFVIDLLREFRPPFSPEAVCGECAALLRAYKIWKVFGDHWAGQFPVEGLRRFGCRYEQSARPKSDLYQDLVPKINSRQVQLLDHERALAQLCSLERRVGRSGRDAIDHPDGQHDDLANAIAGAIAVAASGKRDLVLANYDGQIVQGSLPGSLSKPVPEVYRHLDGTLRLKTDNSCREGPAIPTDDVENNKPTIRVIMPRRN